MAYYNKIGLLVLSSDFTKFLVCEKYPENVTSDYIMPGGQFQETTVEECLRNEIKEAASMSRITATNQITRKDPYDTSLS